MTERGAGVGSERRRSSRYAVSCRCWLEQDAMTLFGTVTNLSAGGMFLRTLPIIREGTSVDVRLSLGDSVVTGRGEVRWRAQSGRAGAAGSHAASGVGIELLDVTGGGDALERFLTETSRTSRPLP